MPRPREFDQDQVLDAAMEAFWVNGYAATSAQDLVERTGLGRSSLYNAFTGKHQLYEQVLSRYLAQNTAGLVAILDGPGPVRARIRELLLGAVDSDLADPERRGCLVVNAAIELAGKDGAVTEQVRLAFGRIEEALAVAIRRGQASGELSAGTDPRAQAKFVLNTLQGLRVLAKAAGDSAAERDGLAQVVESTLRAL